jgi:hypothetical protein
MACLLALLPAAGHDQMWCLYAANLMLHGVKLYGPQLFESNPPLIFWLSLVPSAVAGWLHLPATAVGKLLIVGLEGGVAAVCFRLLRKLQPGMSKAAVYGLGFVFVTVFAVMPARDFGQRDHILALLCLPYLLAAALDAEGRPVVGWKAVCVGLAAGVGIALKPHQALIPVAVESMLLVLRHRRGVRWPVRPEPLAIIACGLAYLIAIHHCAGNYFTQVVPVLRDTYWAIGHLGWLQLVGESVQLHALAAVALSLALVAGWRKVPPFNALLLVAGVASTIAYYLQGTGWYYQQIPALSFFSFVLYLGLLDLAERLHLELPCWTPKAAAALSVLAIALTAYFSGYTLAHPFTFPSGLSDVPDPSFFRGLPVDTPVAILTTVVDDSIPPIVTNHLLWAQRENNLWTLPAILRNESPTAPGDPRRRIPPQRLAQLDRLQHAWMVEDLVYWHPALILIERCQDPAVHCQVLEDRHDDLLAWFLRDPGFRDIFAHYHYVRSSGAFDAYMPN